MSIQLVVIGVALSLLLATACAPILIKKLRILKFGQQIITEYGPTWHKNKQGVPTMGGLIFILSTAVSFLILGIWHYSKGDNFFGEMFLGAPFMALLVSILLGVMGFADDFTKIKQKHNQGLTEKQKIVVQSLIGIAFIVFIAIRNGGDTSVLIPFTDYRLELSFLYYVFAFVAFIGFVNGCNLTDGIDGLAASVTLPVMALYTAVAVFFGATDIAILTGAFFGGLIGYLFFNWHPARVFMGDTGSMFLGGIVVTVAFCLDIPMVLFLAGFVYLAEAFSVLIQQTYYKLTKGKRIFKMTPIHHHFELCNWSEVKIVCVFTAVSFITCALAALWLFL